MAFSTQKNFFHVPFMNETVEYECKKACVKLKSYDSTIDDRSWAMDEAAQSKFLSDLVTCQTPVSGFEGLEGLRGAAGAGARSGLGDGVLGGDSLLECTNTNLAKLDEMLNKNKNLKRQLEISNERLKTATDENRKIKDIMHAKYDSSQSKDFYNKIQKLASSGKLSKSEEKELMDIYNSIEEMNRAYEVLQAENSYVKRLLEKMSRRVNYDSIKLEPEKSTDVKFLQDQVNILRKEVAMLRKMEDDKMKNQQGTGKKSVSEQDAENLKLIIKERNALREKCKTFKELERKVHELQKKSKEADHMSDSLSSDLDNQSKYIGNIENEMKCMHDYFDDQLSKTKFSEELLKCQVAELKEELMRAKCEVRKVECLEIENGCLRNELKRRDFAINDYDCQYKQLMFVIEELQGNTIQNLQDTQTQTCNDYVDDLAFYASATLSEIMKELNKRGEGPSGDGKFGWSGKDGTVAYGLEQRSYMEGSGANNVTAARILNMSPDECCRELERLEKTVQQLNSDKSKIPKDCEELCEEALKKLQELESQHAKLKKEAEQCKSDNERLSTAMQGQANKLDGFSNKLGNIDKEMARNINDTSEIGKDLRQSIQLVKEISDIQLKNKQLAQTVNAQITQDAQKALDDLRRQLAAEQDKNKQCLSENQDLKTEMLKRGIDPEKIIKSGAPAKDGKPITEVSKDGKPITEVSKDGKPITEVGRDGKPITEVGKDGKPLTEVGKDGRPDSAAQKDEKPGTESGKDDKPGAAKGDKAGVDDKSGAAKDDKAGAKDDKPGAAKDDKAGTKDDKPGAAKDDKAGAKDDKPGAAKDDKLGAKDDKPGAAKVDKDGAKDDKPGAAKDDKAGTKEDKPGAAKDDKAGAKDDKPGAARDDKAGAKDDKPGAAKDDKVGAKDDKPGAKDDKPGAAKDDKAGAKDDKPGAAKDDKAGVKGDKPGAAKDDKAGAKGDKPGAAKDDKVGTKDDKPGAAKDDKAGAKDDKPGAAKDDKAGVKDDKPGAAKDDKAGFKDDKPGAAKDDNAGVKDDKPGAAKDDQAGAKDDKPGAPKGQAAGKDDKPGAKDDKPGAGTDDGAGTKEADLVDKPAAEGAKAGPTQEDQVKIGEDGKPVDAAGKQMTRKAGSAAGIVSDTLKRAAADGTGPGDQPGHATSAPVGGGREPAGTGNEPGYGTAAPAGRGRGPAGTGQGGKGPARGVGGASGTGGGASPRGVRTGKAGASAELQGDKETGVDAYNEFITKNAANMSTKLHQGGGLERELRTMLDTFIQECGFCFCKNNIPRSKFYSLVHKLLHYGLRTMSFRELGYVHKKIYITAEKMNPGCLLDMILSEHGNDERLKCCSCKNTLCCSSSEEKLREQVCKLERDFEEARQYFENFKACPQASSHRSHTSQACCNREHSPAHECNRTFRLSQSSSKSHRVTAKQLQNFKVRIMKCTDVVR